MRHFLHPARILTLALLSLLLACSQLDSDQAQSGSPLSEQTSTPTPGPAPLVFPLPTSASLPMITPTPATQPIAPVIPTPTPSTYTIRSGDTLGQIAQRYGLTVDDLIAANPGIDTQILSIGQQIQIPARSESPAFSPPPPADLTIGPLRCVASGAGMWCLAPVSNPYDQPVENIISQIILFSADASPLDSSEALTPLNILSAGGNLPLSAFFSSRPAEPFSAHLEVTTAFLLAPNDPRYLTASVDNLLIQISADGLSARVNGRIILPPENPPAAEIWLAGVAYNEAGQIIGFRRWQSSATLTAGESQTFTLNIYSLDGFIDRLEVYVEARP